MKNYIILSSGAYSDYSPTYFFGDREITQDELQQKAYEIGDKMWAEWEALPERDGEFGRHKYDPLTTKYAGIHPDGNEFIEKMAKWLEAEGYEPVPTGLPEINVYYDVPRSPN
jgi:hypothetical protein